MHRFQIEYIYFRSGIIQTKTAKSIKTELNDFLLHYYRFRYKTTYVTSWNCKRVGTLILYFCLVKKKII